MFAPPPHQKKKKKNSRPYLQNEIIIPKLKNTLSLYEHIGKLAKKKGQYLKSSTVNVYCVLLWALGPITLLVQYTYTCTALYLYRTLMPPI